MSVPADRLLVGSTSGFDDHQTGPGHPERPGRLPAVEAGLADAEIPMVPLAPRAAQHDELARAHDPAYLRSLERFVAEGGGNLDPDTPTSSGSWRSATAAAGATLAAIDGLRAGEGTAGFVACRPPGHHATADRAMGFCLLNNVAVGAAALVAGGERVVILDWDVHHGNGTQEIFWDDPRVLYVSLHQWPLYPGSGRATDTGGAGAPGLTVNVPLPAGATGDVALRALDEVVAPAVDRFGPTWVLVSAGYDAHRDDPLGGLAWSAGDYALLTARAVAFAPGPGRTLAVLEGGYDLGALRRSVTATASGLLGVDVRPEPLTSGGPGIDAVRDAAMVQIQVAEDLR
jgi:acetoin utilization deacetylase AcuC-like enzyme